MVLLAALAFHSITTLPVATQGAAYPHSRAEIVWANQTVRPGETIQVGLRIRMDSGWHVYWKNPGDSGLPPTVTWKLPQGWKASEFAWPIPERIAANDIVNFVYENEVTFPAFIKVPMNAKIGTKAHLGATIKWLCCREACIPGKTTVSQVLPITRTSRKSPLWATRLLVARKGLPVTVPGYPLRATLKNKTVSVFAPSKPEGLIFYPEDNYIDVALPKVTSGPNGETLLQLQVSQYSPGLPSRLRGLLVASKGRPFSSGLSAMPVDIPILRSKP